MLLRALTHNEEPAALALLAEAHLPTDDLHPGAVQLMAAFDNEQLVGVVGLEIRGENGLLRSLCVRPDYRSAGIGALLVSALEGRAHELGIQRLVLLTQTAAAFYARLGYQDMPREHAPQSIREHPQFISLCPASAACMTKRMTQAIS